MDVFFFLFLGESLNIGLSLPVRLGRSVSFYFQITKTNNLSLAVAIMNFNMTFGRYVAFYLIITKPNHLSLVVVIITFNMKFKKIK